MNYIKGHDLHQTWECLVVQNYSLSVAITHSVFTCFLLRHTPISLSTKKLGISGNMSLYQMLIWKRGYTELSNMETELYIFETNEDFK